MPKTPNPEPSGFWECEEHLADLFGLNDSKYQWALDRHAPKPKILNPKICSRF